MDKLCAFLILGFIASQATCMNIRYKRQVDNSSDESTEDLDDRYGFNGPNNGINRPDRFPIQNTFPGQNPFESNMDIVIFGFPNQGMGQGQRPTLRPLPGQEPIPNQQQQTSSTTSAPSTGGVTTMSPSVQACINNCPVTPEYNPVCGTDNVLYTNPGRLTCAQACGVNVSLSRRIPPCPPATPAPN